MYGFNYHRPESLRQALDLLAAIPEAKILAGGHSLIPVMKQRLSAPSDLIDLNAVDGLAGVDVDGDTIVIGAMTRHVDVANSPQVKDRLPALAELAELIGDPAVRHRGTIGGSLANNDPNADYPAAVLGLGATIVTNRRRMVADDFFQGMFETALAADEIITQLRFPVPGHAAYEKFKHPASGFAMVGVFVSKLSSEVRVAVTGAGSNGVFRLEAFEAALRDRLSPQSLEALVVPADGMNVDIHAGADYRAHLVGVLARRAVAKAERRKVG